VQAAVQTHADFQLETRLLTPLQAMAILGYDNQDAFMRMVRRAGIPRIIVNKRVIRFDPMELSRWTRKRAVRCA